MAAAKTTKAIVAYEPPELGKTNWKMEDVTVSEVRDDEVLVRMIASGICHTDAVLSSVPQGYQGVSYPRVVGHEGSGYVLAKGSKVTSVEVGDPVLMAAVACGACSFCKTDHPAYCTQFVLANYVCEPGRFTLTGTSAKASGNDVSGSFFGQSSFAGISCVKESGIVNAKSLIKNEEELKLFAPLGCGIETGAGAVLNVAQAHKDSDVVVFGLGGVGLGSIMTAKIVGCRKIIAVDRHESRLEVARELGATHVINTSKVELVEEIRKLTGGAGASICVDTSGAPPLLNDALKLLANMGKLVLVGVPPPGFKLEIDVVETIQCGKQVLGCIIGDCIPKQLIPRMIEWYHEGKFPIDKFIKFSEAANFGKMVEEMHSGECIKPVIVW